MNIVNDINKVIIKKVIEILLVVCFLFLSFHLWRNKNISSLASLMAANQTGYTSLDIENPIDYVMYPMKDEDALNNLAPCFLKVINGTYSTESYQLILVVSKESTLDYHYLNISLGDKVYPLMDLPIREDEGSYVFLLDEGTICGETKEYEARIWLDKRTGNDMQSKQLVMSFDLINEATKM